MARPLRARAIAVVATSSIGAAAALLIPSIARADPSTPGFSCGEQYSYVPPAYNGLSAGDAILIPRGDGDDALTPLFAAVDVAYRHAMLAWDNSGSVFAESQWDGNPPPTTQATGGDHECSRIFASAYLQSLNPGTTGTGVSDPAHIFSDARIIQQMGTPYCNTPPDAYHFNSFIHDDVVGGSCEKYLADECGVPVQEGDKKTLPGGAMNAGLQGLYWVTYQKVLSGAQSEAGGISFLCGGVDPTIIAQRGSMQVVNEIRWKWYELQQPDGNSTDYLGIDTNAEGVWMNAPWGWLWEDLGGGSQNTQWSGPGYSTTPGDYCTDVNSSNQTPGGSLQGEGADCPSWNNYGNSFTMNVPDDIENANNNHVSHGEYQASVSGGYYQDLGNFCQRDADQGAQDCADLGFPGATWAYYSTSACATPGQGSPELCCWR